MLRCPTLGQFQKYQQSQLSRGSRWPALDLREPRESPGSANFTVSDEHTTWTLLESPSCGICLCSSHQTLGVAPRDGPQANLRDVTSNLFPNKDITVCLSFFISKGVRDCGYGGSVRCFVDMACRAELAHSQGQRLLKSVYQQDRCGHHRNKCPCPFLSL